MANVFYEVGICHALEIAESYYLRICILDRLLPFDLRHLRVLLYTIILRIAMAVSAFEGTLIRKHWLNAFKILRSTSHG